MFSTADAMNRQTLCFSFTLMTPLLMSPISPATSQGPPMENVFILPELILNIGKFLSRHDLAVCTRVSYLFNTTLSPLLFQDIHVEVDLRLPRSLRTFPRERFDTFCKHAADVHHLVLAHRLYRGFFHSGYCFRQLKTLKIGRESNIWEADPFTADDDSASMVPPKEDAALLGRMISAEMCPMLKELSLSELRPVPLHPFWRSLQDSKTIHTFKWLSGPTELRCSYPRWAGEQSSNYWLSLPRSISRDKFLAGFRFTNLRHVQLRGLVRLTPEEQLRFLCRCPEVRTVTWHASLCKYPSEKAKALFQTRAWPYVHSLDIEVRELGDEDLKLILDHNGGTGPAGCLQRLTIWLDVAASKAFDSLRRHFGSLRSINLNQGLTSAMAQEIMSSCPELENITGKYILATDILYGRPWVCRRLRTFHLSVVVSESAEKQQNAMDRAVFGLFASLPCLQQFWMTSLTDLRLRESRPPGRLLRCTLDAGLDQLAGLTQMRDVNLDQAEPHLDIESLAWMLEHWPRLRTIGGLRHHSSSQNLALFTQMLKERNITLS